MPKETIRDKLEGNEVDLSLSNLSTVPVKELAGIPKGTHLDLSCNSLTVLPDAFCTLRHLVKIDLSKNALQSLPSGFGMLQNLQQLDLLSNQIHILPVNFWQLKRLRWLDLKDNPLEPGLKANAGDCLDELQCRKCAERILLYMKAISSDLERKKQKRLQEEREQENERKLLEEKERIAKKADKLIEKERRRKEYEAQKLQYETKTTDTDSEESDHAVAETTSNGIHSKENYTRKEKSSSSSVFFIFFSVLVAVTAIFIGLYFFCDANKKVSYCQQLNQHVGLVYRQAKMFIQKYTAT